MSIEWHSMATAGDGTKLLLFKTGIIATGARRYGQRGEPQQEVLDWRCDCCGRYGGVIAWAPLPNSK